MKAQGSIAVRPVSVVIPLYNQAAFIGGAIDSIWRQTQRPAEIIVVDDGSTDGGADVVNRIPDPRLRVIRQSNRGVSAARNAGIAAARFPLIAFLDADDQWMPRHISSILEMQSNHPECEVFGTSYMFRSSGEADRPAIVRRSQLKGSSGVLPDYFRTAGASDPPLCSSSVAVTKSALAEIGGFPVGIAQGEDLLTWARLAVRFRIAYCLCPTVSVWCPDFDSARPTRRPEIPDPVGAKLRELLETVSPRQRKSLRKYLGLWHRMRGTMFLRLGDRDSAREELGRSLRYSALNARSLVYTAAAHFPGPLMPTALAALRGIRAMARRPGTVR